MEKVIIRYCTAECGDDYVTTGSVHHTTWNDGEEATSWYNNYEDGVDLDPDNEDNSNNDCGEWHDKQPWDDTSDELAGGNSKDRSTCPTGDPWGYFRTGVDSDEDGNSAVN